MSGDAACSPAGECRAEGAGLGRGLALLVGVLLALGAASRALPLFDQGGRLLRQFPAEDGYLMLTIARNLALGNGMSTADGTIPTNGTQPGMTFVFALGSRLFGGDKTATVTFALVVEFAVAACAVAAVYALGRRALGARPGAARAAALGAAVWYAADHVVRQTMNGLETGANALCAVLVARELLGGSGDPARAWSPGRAVRIGLLLGLAFWIRIDAVFLIAATCLVRWWLDASGGAGRLRPNASGFRQACIAGLTAVAVASPWLVHNHVRFGSIMPISGSSQSWAYGFGENVPVLPITLLELGALVLPIPARFEGHTAVMLVATSCVAAALAFAWRFGRRADLRGRLYLLFAGLYGAALVGYYGLFFGAPWFLSRYLFPLAALAAPLWGLGVLALWRRLGAGRARVLAPAAAAVLVLLVGLRAARTYENGADHMHFQVVEWVADNVGPEEWVAAVQSGTVGYFHDKTINLDGKVNPNALAAMLANRLDRYLVESPARYFADWAQVAVDWYQDPEHPIVREHFELLVEDHTGGFGLGVLARREVKAGESQEGR